MRRPRLLRHRPILLPSAGSAFRSPRRAALRAARGSGRPSPARAPARTPSYPVARLRQPRLRACADTPPSRAGSGRRCSALSARDALELAARLLDCVVTERVHDLGTIQQAPLLVDREPVLHVAILEDRY